MLVDRSYSTLMLTAQTNDFLRLLDRIRGRPTCNGPIVLDAVGDLCRSPGDLILLGCENALMSIMMP